MEDQGKRKSDEKHNSENTKAKGEQSNQAAKEKLLENVSEQMSSASFIKEPYPSTKIIYQVDFEDFIESKNYNQIRSSP